jgi:hypothetical protein
MMPPAQRIPEARIDPLILEVYPGGTQTYRLYEDDGITEFEHQAQDSRTILSWSGGAERRINIRFKGEAEPREILVQAVETGSSIQFETELIASNTLEVRLPPTKGAKIEILTAGS